MSRPTGSGRRGSEHSLKTVLRAAASGVFPSVDGGVTYLPDLPDGNRAVVALTGHALIASPLGADDFDSEPVPDGFGGALHLSVLQRIAQGGSVGVNDVTLVARGTEGPCLEPTDRYDSYSRVRAAHR